MGLFTYDGGLAGRSTPAPALSWKRTLSLKCCISALHPVAGILSSRTFPMSGRIPH